MVMITMFDADLLLTLMCKLLSSIYQAFFLHWTQPQRKVTNRSGEFAVSEYSAWPFLLWGRNCHWPAFPGDAGRLDCFQRAVEGDDYLSQQDGAPSHWNLVVRRFLSAGPQVLGKRPARSPVLALWLLSLGECEEHRLRIAVSCNSGGTGNFWSSSHDDSGSILERLDRTRLAHRCLPSNQRGARGVPLMLPNNTRKWMEILHLKLPTLKDYYKENNC